MKKIVILLVTAMLLYMCSCGTDDIDISGYSDAEIALEGISDETAAVTVKQLKAMDCHTIKTESTSDKIGVVKATGVWLSDVLSEYGLEQGDFSSLQANMDSQNATRLNALLADPQKLQQVLSRTDLSALLQKMK